MSIQRAFVATAIIALTAAAPRLAIAQNWPSNTVHITIGFAAGGGTDVATRIVAEALTKNLGQQFIVENKPGAGGTLAGGQVARSTKDGYNLLAISMGHAASAVTVKNVPYDPVNDFAPIGIFTNSAFVVVVPKDSPATDLKSLVEYVNKQDGKLNYSTVTVGSTQHFIAEELKFRLGIKAQAVAYRETPQVITALLRGDAAYAVELYHPIRGNVESGNLRIIAVATPKRWPAIPNVPTFSESGLPGYGILGWYALVGPAGTPQPIIDKLHKAMETVLATDEVKKQLEGVGATANLSTPAELRKTIESDIARFKEVAAKAGIEAK